MSPRGYRASKVSDLERRVQMTDLLDETRQLIAIFTTIDKRAKSEI